MASREIEIRDALLTLYVATDGSAAYWLMRWSRDNPEAFRNDRWWERGYTFTL